MLHRQRLTVHRDRQQCVPAVQHGLHRRERIECLLMAVAVHERLLHRQRFQFELQTSGFFFAHEEFLEEKRMLREAPRFVAETVLQKFVAQRQPI